MPDRPRNDGPEDGPDYQWLYGSKGEQPQDPQATRPVPRQQRPTTPGAPQPDETRVMRTQARPQQPRPSSRPVPPPLAPSVQPPTQPPADRRRPRRRRRFRARYVFLLLLLWLAYLVAVPIVAWNKVDKLEWEPDGDRPADQPGTTYLLVGSDSRAGLTKAERKELATGNAGGGRTDTIMLLHTGSGPNLLLSIPRDSMVEIPGHGVTKINAAYALGEAPLLVETIEQNTGIRVDDYIEIGMGGVAGLVDAVGGIQVCPKTDMVDKLAGLNIKKGCQEADGTTALAYARSRHTSGIGDIDRVRRQREVVAAVGAKVVSPWTVINPVRWWRLNNAIPDFFKFGEGMGPARTLMWATAMTRVNGKDGLTCVVPLQDLAVTWDPERAPQMFDKVIKDETDTIDDELCSDTGGIQ
jgi:LCP family protein required for cell wall assembly